MAYITKLIVFFVGLSLTVHAYGFDFCKVKPPIKEDFELLKIAGRWYEFAGYPNVFTNLNTERCYSQFMTVDGEDIWFTTTFIRKNGTSDERHELEGKITSDPGNPGKVRVTMPTVGLKGTFSVVDAKYDDYVIFYICNITDFKTEIAWILTRDAHLSDVRKKSLLEKLKSLKIDTERLQFDSQENC